MAKNQKYIKITYEEIDAIIKKMEALPPKPRSSNGMIAKSEVLEKFAPTIRQMLQRGYSVKNIAEFLKEQSVEVSAVSLSKTTVKTHRRRPKPENPQTVKQDHKQPMKQPAPFGKTDEV